MYLSVVCVVGVVFLLDLELKHHSVEQKQAHKMKTTPPWAGLSRGGKKGRDPREDPLDHESLHLRHYVDVF